MIPIRRPDETDALQAKTRTALAKRQATAGGFPAGDARIQPAWDLFMRSVPKDDVSEALDRTSRSKCVYCEAVAAQDIDHFYPKAAHPTRMFRWDNLRRGCKNCNNFKRDIFPMGEAGHVLLDPCKDDPLDYFVYDYVTGAIGVRPGPGFEDRATETRTVFHLDQGPLDGERRAKAQLILYLLSRVINETPISGETKERLKDELDESRPWLGIVRQLFLRPGKYNKLIDAARKKLPAIEQWLKPWISPEGPVTP